MEETEKAKDPKIFFGRSTKDNQNESKSKIKAPTIFPVTNSTQPQEEVKEKPVS